MKTVELTVMRDTEIRPTEPLEGSTLGKVYADAVYLGETMEDQDLRLEEGNPKQPGISAIPTGRYRLTLYHSPKHGVVPLFHDVPGFTYIEMHAANKPEELRGCIAVGRIRTARGVATCAPVLARIVNIMQAAEDEGVEVYCTVKRAGEP